MWSLESNDFTLSEDGAFRFGVSLTCLTAARGELHLLSCSKIRVFFSKSVFVYKRGGKKKSFLRMILLPPKVVTTPVSVEVFLRITLNQQFFRH